MAMPEDDFEELVEKLRSSHALLKLEIAKLQSQVAFRGEAPRTHLEGGSQSEGPTSIPEPNTAIHKVRTPLVRPSSFDTAREVLPESKPAWASDPFGRQVSPSSQQSENKRQTSSSSLSFKSSAILRQSISAILPMSSHEESQVIPHSVVAERIEHASIWDVFKDLAHRPMFEATFACLIFLNCLTMSLEAQKRGLIIGMNLSKEGGSSTVLPAAFTDDAGGVWPGADLAFEVCNMIFGIAFLVEVVIKVLAYRFQFACHMWNVIDLLIVVLWIASLFGSAFAIDPNVLRVARLARLARLLRLVKTIQGFDALYLISTALKSSVSILAWSVVMFFLMQITLALLLTNILADSYSEEDNLPHSEREAVYIYFGTVTRATFSMFELTLANWPPVARLLAENVSEWYMFFGVLHKLTIGFAFVGVVNGVFIQEAFNVASTDDKIMVTHKKRLETTHYNKMNMFFRQADRSGDGAIDIDEFSDMLSNEGVAVWLASQGLEPTDANLLFTMIDRDGDGNITLEELVKGVARLKGLSRSIDLVRVMEELKLIRQDIESHITSLHTQLS
eukprot:TRINITY_DN27340_c0_g2_i1.p1 TRINITY_DN27340_c0_g2~~TRINITY_DN27340_c0_g2_i1.p1  ORF type:complete len:571 (+),score=89.83 TRINITY_DN27340_c0_g2_i1:30-1715(+)